MTRTETIEPESSSKGTWDLTALQEELDKVDRYRGERDAARLHIEELKAQLSRLKKENFDYKYKVKAYEDESRQQPDMYRRRYLEKISDLKAENRQLREEKDCIASRTRSKTRAAASAGKAPAETAAPAELEHQRDKQKDEETRSGNAMTRHTTKFWMVGAKTELTARRRAAVPHN